MCIPKKLAGMGVEDTGGGDGSATVANVWTGELTRAPVLMLGIGTPLVATAAGITAPVLKTTMQATIAQAAAAYPKELLGNIRTRTEGDWQNIFNLARSSSDP
jgi:hypothetical protein